jgi:hypothetical protein
LYRSVQRQLIFWTVLVVLTVGGLAAFVCLQPPTSEADLFVSRAYNRKHPLAKYSWTKDRAPASPKGPDQKLAPTQPLNDQDSPALSVDCETKTNLAVDFKQQLVRLKGSACHNKSVMQSSDIRNESNGTTATVFLDGSQGFITDFLSLQPGENHIRIARAFKDGSRKVTELVIDRQQPTAH